MLFGERFKNNFPLIFHNHHRLLAPKSNALQAWYTSSVVHPPMANGQMPPELHHLNFKIEHSIRSIPTINIQPGQVQSGRVVGFYEWWCTWSFWQFTFTTCTWTSNVLSDFNVLCVGRHRMGVLCQTGGFAETQYIIIKIFELFYYFTVQISTKFGVFQVEL